MTVEKTNVPYLGPLQRLVDMMASLLAGVASFALMFIMILMITDVVARNFLEGSIPGIYELIETLIVSVVFLGLANAERRGTNVRMEILVSRLPIRWQRAASLVSDAALLVIVSWFSYASWQSAMTSLSRSETVSGLVSYPIWPARIVIAGCFILLLAVILTRLVETVTKIIGTRGANKRIDTKQEAK